jgi:hypothetical protein
MTVIENIYSTLSTHDDRDMTIGLHHPLDGVTNPEYKLLHFIQITIFCKEKKALPFNRDGCCHLALCLWLILFHCNRLVKLGNTN